MSRTLYTKAMLERAIDHIDFQINDSLIREAALNLATQIQELHDAKEEIRRRREEEARKKKEIEA